MLFLQFLDFCAKWGFYFFHISGHVSGSRHARGSIKGSKDADDHLVSKTSLSQKQCSLDWHPGTSKFGQKWKNMPFCDVTKGKPQTQIK